MHFPHFPFSSILFPSIILIILLFAAPTSLASLDEQYLNCSRTFQCANIKSVGYPFWGGQNRPDFCGLPGFKLDCSGDVPKITIKMQSYRVLDINIMSQTLTLARTDLSNVCPTLFVNSTLDYDLFNYTSNTRNLMLYYNCPPIPELSGQFTCLINSTNITSYYVTDDAAPAVVGRLTTCGNSLIVRVFQTTLQNLENESVDLLTAISAGFGLQWTVNKSLCDQCSKSGGLCGYDPISHDFTCFCPDKPYGFRCPPLQIKNAPTIWLKFNNRLVSLVFSSGVIATSLLIMVPLCKACCNRCRRRKSRSRKNDKNVEEFIANQTSLSPKRYSYSQVKKMTKSFKNKLGQGGYGVVYRGKLSDGRLVAVKLLNESKGNGEEFINEVASISKTSHVNIVTLLGFCYDKGRRALITEFMPNGSLDKYIYDQSPPGRTYHLEWKTLYQIAIGIARGLEYLHQGCNTRILHFDIKPHNILLDEKFCPKISDFGMAKLCEKKESIVSMVDARGTIGYIAPEVFLKTFGRVSHKSDVYSYGMMVLEMVGGRRNFDQRATNSSEAYFPDWIYKQLEPGEDLKLHGVETEEEEEIARKMVTVGLWCIQPNPSDRPPMTKVVEMLAGSLQSLPIPPQPSMSPPERSFHFSSSTEESSIATELREDGIQR